MREYITRRIDAVHVIDANGNEVPADMLDSLGLSLLTGETVSPPTLGPAIADRTYVVGSAPVTIDLSQRFIGAISYGMTPTNIPGVTRSGAIVTIDPAATRATTAITVSGTNAGGTVSMTFNLTVNAVSPTSTAALPDQSLTVGDTNVSLALGSYFANASSYAVSPTGQGVTISGSTLTISAAAVRNATYTVTASNSTGQTVSDTFALVVTAAVTAPSYQRMVVIGASQERDLFGNPSLTTQSADGTSDMGFPVYSIAVSGTGITDTNGARKQIADALAQWSTPGETLFLIGSVSGNPITAVIAGGLSDAEADAIASDYNSMLDLFGAHLPHVHALQTSFRSYTNHGFSGSQLFDNPDLGSANLNDRLTPIFQSRLNQSLYYANGDSMVDWYDLTRNNYATWIRDGIHHTTALLPTIRQTLTSRLRAAIEGNPPAAVVPAARPALAALVTSVAAPTATVGVEYSYGAGRLFNLWDASYSTAGLPAWATVSRDPMGQFTITGTPTASGPVSIEITATSGGITQVSTVSLTVAAAGSTVYPALTTAGGTPAYTTGRFGQAMNSAGTFYARADTSLTPLTAAWGAEAWVKIPTATRSNIFFGESGSAFYGIVRSGTTPSPAGVACFTYRIANDTSVQFFGGPRIDDDQWHHVAVQFRSNGADLFVDGVLVASNSSPIWAGRLRDGAGTANDSRFTVGHYASATTFIWSGQVDEVRIWDGLALTSAFTPRTTAYTTLPAGTVAYWALDGNLTGGIPA